MDITFDTIFYGLVIAGAIFLILQRNTITIYKREQSLLSNRISKARKATADILHLSRNVITTDINVEEFLTCFVEYVMKSIQGDGAAVLTYRKGKLHGCSVTGNFPPINKVPPELEKELLADAQKHTEYIRQHEIELSMHSIKNYCQDKNFAFFNYEKPRDFPPNFFKYAPATILTPIKVNKKVVALLIVTSKNDSDYNRLTIEDAYYLERLGELAAMSIEIIKVTRERKDYEMRIQAAREEGMLQVSTGIIHNIGNAITVSKLAVLELKEALSEEEERPESLILDEVLPTLRKKIENETVLSFLKHDPIGSQYIDIMQELLQHTKDVSDKSREAIVSLENKLNHISEIIQLQQRFAGDLGSESMTDLASVIESAIKIFEESCNKRDVEIKLDFKPGVSDVHIDPSMMIQVFMNLTKNAIEAMDKDESGRKHFLKISLSEETIDDEKCVITRFRDNGPGIPDNIIEHIFDFGFSTKGKERSRGFGLAFCQNTVNRYNGTIDVESKMGEGTVFQVNLPAAEKE